jgi:uncharacterized membrane protein
VNGNAEQRFFLRSETMEEKPYEPVSVPPPQTPNSAYPPPAYAAPAAGGLSQNTAAALAYITIIPAILFLILEPYNKMAFVRFHAWQCISLAVVWFAGNVVFAFIPILHFFLIPLFGLLMFVVWLLTLLKASKGEWFKLPVIGDFAMGQSQA